MTARTTIILAFLMFLGPLALRAQESWEKENEGEIKDVEIEIVKNKRIVLPRANRNFEKVPPRPFEPIEPAIRYELRNFQIATRPYSPSLRPLKLKQEEQSRAYGNYVSGGVGNYSSLFAEASVTSRRSQSGMMGAHFFHRSFGSGPVNDNFSASGRTQLDLFGKHMGKDLTVSGQALYGNQAGYFYGYSAVPETDRSNIRQTFDQIALQLNLENTRKGDFNYVGGLKYSHLSDHYAARESELSATFQSDTKLSSGTLTVNGDAFLITREDAAVASATRTLFRIKSAYTFQPLPELTVKAGANVALDNDVYAGSKSVHVYPMVYLGYDLSKSVKVYGQVTGDMDKVNLHTLSAENFWLNANQNLYHTNRALDFSAGLKGRLGAHVAFHTGVSMATLKNYYFYLNNGATDRTNKFNVLYDPNTRRINPFAELTFNQSERVGILLRGDYFQYETESLTEAYHRPTYKVQLQARYNGFGKFTIDGGLTAQGGMVGYDSVLSSAVDVQLHARYFLSRQFSVFMHLDNILGQKYPIYDNYLSRGFQALGGVSWAF